jgi:protein O-GlcNAc transferase
LSADVVRLLEEGRYDRARDALQRMLRADPKNPHLLDALAVVHVYLGEFDRSIYFSQAALAILPRSGPLLVTYANTLSKQGKIALARAQYEMACQAPDAPASAWSGLSALMCQEHDVEQALRIAQQGLQRFPPTGPLVEAYFSALNLSGRAAMTVQEAPRWLALADSPMARVLVAVAANYADNLMVDQVQALHRDAGQAFAKHFVPRQHDWTMSRDKARALRVGILSSDLRHHPVAAFAEALFAGHDRSKITLCVFSTSGLEDDTTRRLRGYAAEWASCAGKSEEAIRDQIIAKKIDVLVEWNGLTNGHRMGVCAMRAAPIQITYCGYPNTTGLPGMDYRLVDDATDPKGEAIWHSESLLYMDGCFLCYTPAANRPATSLSASIDRPITFGSFNALAKISDHSLRLWARALRAVPGARLLIKALGLKEPAAREHLMERCVQVGMDAARIELRGPAPDASSHLLAYLDVDIALDTVPYHGTTTTCEALSMGVPVITLRGDRHAARVGASVLTAAGFSEWIARDEVDFERIVTAVSRLADLRTGRQDRAARMLASSLCDAAAWNQRFETAIRSAWAMWCDGGNSKP